MLSVILSYLIVSSFRVPHPVWWSSLLTQTRSAPSGACSRWWANSASLTRPSRCPSAPTAATHMRWVPVSLLSRSSALVHAPPPPHHFSSNHPAAHVSLALPHQSMFSWPSYSIITFFSSSSSLSFLLFPLLLLLLYLLLLHHLLLFTFQSSWHFLFHSPCSKSSPAPSSPLVPLHNLHLSTSCFYFCYSVFFFPSASHSIFSNILSPHGNA